MTYFAFDTETSGLSARRNSILSLACILLDQHFRVVEERVWYMHPVGDVETEALAVNGYTKEAWDSRGATAPASVYAELCTWLRSYDAKKLIPVGHNPKFDLDFLEAFFATHAGTSKYRNLFDYHCLDTIGVAILVDMVHFGARVGNYNLKVLCERYGIPLLNAHDALEDVRACIELYRVLRCYLSPVGTLPDAVPAFLRETPDGWVYRTGKHKDKPILVDRGYAAWVRGNISGLTRVERDALEAALTSSTTIPAE